MKIEYLNLVVFTATFYEYNLPVYYNSTSLSYSVSRVSSHVELCLLRLFRVRSVKTAAYLARPVNPKCGLRVECVGPGK